MKIEINTKPDKKFYDELLFVTYNYHKIKKNPNKKITLMTKDIMKQIVLCVILLFISLFSYFRNNGAFFLFMLGFICLLLLFLIIYLVAIKKKISLFVSDKNKSIIDISKSGIGLIKDNSHNVKMDWESIEFILINKYSICLLPKKPTDIMIALGSEYKEGFIAGIEKYNKENLVIDNTNLYE